MATSDCPRDAAVYMSGVFQSLARNGDVPDTTIENINEELEAAGLEHVSIKLE